LTPLLGVGSVQVTETIKKIIAKQLSRSPEEITDDSELASLGIESLDLLEIVYEIETQFKIHVPYSANDPGELRLSTVGDVVRAVQAAVNAR
jgi:acyl carrier protein